MYEPTFNPDKFRGLILYAAHRARQYEDPFFGAVKLNKTLFFSDFFGFRQLGRSITGATYQKLSEGPAPRQLVDERQKPPMPGQGRWEQRVQSRQADAKLIDRLLAKVYDGGLHSLTAQERKQLTEATERPRRAETAAGRPDRL